MRIGLALILLAVVTAGCGSEAEAPEAKSPSEPKGAPEGLVLKDRASPGAGATGTRPGR